MDTQDDVVVNEFEDAETFNGLSIAPTCPFERTMKQEKY